MPKCLVPNAFAHSRSFSLAYGCTPLLHSLAWHLPSLQFKPTTGFNFEVVSKVFRGAKYEFHMWDLAGKPEVR